MVFDVYLKIVGIIVLRQSWCHMILKKNIFCCKCSTFSVPIIKYPKAYDGSTEFTWQSYSEMLYCRETFHKSLSVTEKISSVVAEKASKV